MGDGSLWEDPGSVGTYRTSTQPSQYDQHPQTSFAESVENCTLGWGLHVACCSTEVMALATRCGCFTDMSIWTTGWNLALQVTYTCTRKKWTWSSVSRRDPSPTCCLWSATATILVELESHSFVAFTGIVLVLFECKLEVEDTCRWLLGMVVWRYTTYVLWSDVLRTEMYVWHPIMVQILRYVFYHSCLWITYQLSK